MFKRFFGKFKSKSKNKPSKVLGSQLTKKSIGVPTNLTITPGSNISLYQHRPNYFGNQRLHILPGPGITGKQVSGIQTKYSILQKTNLAKLAAIQHKKDAETKQLEEKASRKATQEMIGKRLEYKGLVGVGHRPVYYDPVTNIEYSEEAHAEMTGNPNYFTGGARKTHKQHKSNKSCKSSKRNVKSKSRKNRK